MTHQKLLRRASALAIVAGLATGGALPVVAQEGEDADAPEVIVITTTKREESVQDVSVAVTAVTGETLVDKGVFDITNIDILVPGLQFGQSGNDARPAIRGVRTEQVIGNAEPPVAFYVDGVYRSRPGQAFASFVDVNRVEVARGPQGTLFGRNAFGGAVNVISNDPVMGELDYGADIFVQNFNGLRTTGFVNIPVTDTVAVRVAGYRSRQDGFVDNLTDSDNDIRDDNRDYLRGIVRWEPTDRFDATLRADYFRTFGNGNGAFGYNVIGVPIDPQTGLTNAVTGVLDPRIGADPDGVVPGGRADVPFTQAADTDPFEISRNGDFRTDVEQVSVSGELNYDFGPVLARGIFSYADYDEFRQDDGDFSPVASVLNANLVEAETTSQEIQLISNTDSRLEWVLGGYFLQDESTDAFFQFVDDGSRQQTFATVQAALETTSFAGYADGSFSILDPLRVIGGIRYTSDDRDIVVTPVDSLDTTSFTGAPARTGSDTFDQVTFRAGVEYDFRDNTLLYAVVSNGFISGSFNGGTAPAQESFDEQTVDALEFGAKTAFDLGQFGTGTANVAVYYNQYEDLLSQQFVETVTDTGSVVLESFFGNGGEVDAVGAEIEVFWNPVPEAYLNTLISINQSEFGEFLLPNPFQDAPVNTLDPGLLEDGVQVFDLEGLSVPLQPEFTLTVSGGYEFDLGEYGRVTPSVDFFFSDEYRTSDQPFALGVQDAYTSTALRVEWVHPDEQFSAQAFVENVENEEILLRTLRFGGDLLAQEYAAPRIFGIRLSYRR